MDWEKQPWEQTDPITCKHQTTTHEIHIRHPKVTTQINNWHSNDYLEKNLAAVILYKPQLKQKLNLQNKETLVHLTIKARTNHYEIIRYEYKKDQFSTQEIKQERILKTKPNLYDALEEAQRYIQEQPIPKIIENP